MKHTTEKIKKMLEDYFREVAANNREEFTDEDYKVLIEECTFRVIENITQAKELPREDILFYMSSIVGNYHVFFIQKNRLIEVHQEHAFRWCLTCDGMGEKSPYVDRE